RNLAQVNWGNYDLVVIDESHNFRNAGLTYSDKENRYQKLLRKVIREGVSTKVLMLSATPVNNRFNDLKNQLALAYEGDPQKIDEQLETKHSVDTIFSRAQKAFNEWSKMDIEDRTTERLLDMLDFDFFEILDSLTIARSRKHITTYYDTTAMGKFPTRNKPESISCSLTKHNNITYTQIAEQLSLFNLSVYTPLTYLLPGREEKYGEKYDKEVKTGRLTQRDRERSLKILMHINLLKRLESSVDSFKITISGIVDHINNTLQFLEKEEKNAFDSVQLTDDSENFDWDSSWGDEENLIGKKIKVHLRDLDKTRWQEDLQEDLKLFKNLLKSIEIISPEKDNKLQHLIAKIEHKIKNPI